jgi:hypothetical protein
VKHAVQAFAEIGQLTAGSCSEKRGAECERGAKRGLRVLAGEALEADDFVVDFAAGFDDHTA